jgi:hypothetical protein
VNKYQNITLYPTNTYNYYLLINFFKEQLSPNWSNQTKFPFVHSTIEEGFFWKSYNYLFNNILAKVKKDIPFNIDKDSLPDQNLVRLLKLLLGLFVSGF